VVQRKHLSEEEADTAFWANLLLGSILFVLANLLAADIAVAYNQPDLKGVIHALSVLFLVTPLGAMHSARLTRDLRFKLLAYRALASSLAGAAVGIPMALAGYGIWALVGQRIVTAVTIVLVCWHALPWRPRMRLNLGKFRDLVSFGGYLSASNLILQLNSRIAELASGFFVGPVAVSLIRAGSRCIDIVNQVTFVPVQQISMPIQARAQHDAGGRQRNYASLSRLSAAIMFPAYLGCFAISRPLVNSLFGSEWIPASDAIRILAVNVVPLQMNALIIANLVAAGFSRSVFGWSIAQMVCGLLAAYLTFPYGWQAMLIGNVVRSYLLLPLGWYLVNRCIGIRTGVVFGSVWPALLSAIVMGVCTTLLEHFLRGALPDLALLFLLPLFGAAIYMGLFVAIDRSIIVLAAELWRKLRPASRP